MLVDGRKDVRCWTPRLTLVAFGDGYTIGVVFVFVAAHGALHLVEKSRHVGKMDEGKVFRIELCFVFEY